jgi:transposase
MARDIYPCEWGHNRDNEKLPQINICMLFGEKSRLPVYQTLYSGSLSDVSTLKSTLNEFKAIVGKKPISFVMDKDLFSQKNVAAMLSSNVKFLLSVPFTNSFARILVDNERPNIDHVNNLILTKNSAIRGVHRIIPWGKDKNYTLNAHVLFDPEKMLKERNELFRQLGLLKQIAMKDPINEEHRKQIEEFLIVGKTKTVKSEYTVKIREDVVDKILATNGWLVLVSNHIKNVQTAYDLYQMKDVVEKAFWKYKNSLGLDRLRVHTDERADNKTFIAFIALILSSYVHNTMRENDMYKSMTFDKLFLTLAKLKSATIGDMKFLRPKTKQQKLIYDSFGIQYPDIK